MCTSTGSQDFWIFPLLRPSMDPSFPKFSIHYPAGSQLLLLSLVHTLIHTHTLTHSAHRHTQHTCSASGQVTSLAAGAFAAVYDGQDDRLALAALTLQAEETDRVVRVQTVTTALAH